MLKIFSENKFKKEINEKNSNKNNPHSSIANKKLMNTFEIHNLSRENGLTVLLVSAA